MILAAADAAEYGQAAPPELITAFRTEQWGPPWAGGWMEWPAGEVGRMTAARNVHRAISAYKSVSGNLAEWVNRNKGIFEVYTSILVMRDERMESSRWAQAELERVARVTRVRLPLLVNYWQIARALYGRFSPSPWQVARLVVHEVKTVTKYWEYPAEEDGRD